MNGDTDTELLNEFADSRSEAAFNELVSRYVTLVYSAAARMVVDGQLAQDVTQSAFVALAQSAPAVLRKVRSGTPLSGWLHVTTRNIAAKMVRTEERRRAREKEAASMYEIDKIEESRMWEQVAPHLDASLGSLREQDRCVLLLRFFEKKTVKEIAEHFGSREEAMQKRISRALEALRRSLMRQGANVPCSALAGLLTANSLQAAPVALVAGLAQAALTSANLMAPGTLAWSMKIIEILTMTKTQVAITVALVAGLGVPFVTRQSSLAEVRAALGAPFSQAAPPAEQVTPTAVMLREGEQAEIERLRKMAADLRARLAAKNSQQQSQREATSPAAPVLLTVGAAVSLFDLGYAGTKSPEAALQSFLAFKREGDLEGFLRVTVFPPSQAKDLEEMLGSEEHRQHFVEGMREAMLGAVVSQSVQRREDGSTAEPVVKEVWPENPFGEVTVEILEKEQIDDKRVRISTKIVRGADAKTETYTLGRTKTGWKHLLL